jgi:uncharacterized protein with HEPN domain
MYDKEIVLDLLTNMIDASEKIIKRTSHIKSTDDFLKDDNSLILLDSTCMQLIAIGEAVKKIDTLTNKELFKNYPNIPWREVAGMRDIISHHYFDLNAGIVFDVVNEHIESLKDTLIEIKSSI